MASFTLKYKIAPPWPFGLPDGARIVLPSGFGSVTGPSLDTRTGELSSHGTLPVYRAPDAALNVRLLARELELHLHDNYLALRVDADSIQAAHQHGAEVVDRFCQALSVQYGVRFSASFLHIEDPEGSPKGFVRPKITPMMELATYDLSELQHRVDTAFEWAQVSDARTRKALLYFEHAFLLREFSQSLELFSPHAALSRALAFLQLFKAITVILGEPGTDRDYQRRFKALGLPEDFWSARVAPLYTVRNDEDVAHYRLDPPDPSEFADRFGEAIKVFRDALAAHVAQATSARDA